MVGLLRGHASLASGPLPSVEVQTPVPSPSIEVPPKEDGTGDAEQQTHCCLHTLVLIGVMS